MASGEAEWGVVACLALPYATIIQTAVTWYLPWQSPYTEAPIFLPGMADACPSQPAEIRWDWRKPFPLEDYYEDLITTLDVSTSRHMRSCMQVDNFWPEDFYMNFLGNRWDGSMPYGKVCGDINNDISPATTVAEVKAAAQTIIDDMFGY